LILVALCSVWIDGWVSLQSISLDMAGLAAPVGLAICFYLAAAVVFPHHDADHERLADYYRERKGFVVGMLIAAAILTDVSYRGVLQTQLEREQAVIWLWVIPYSIALFGSMIALLFVRSRRANLVLLGALILLTTIPYWSAGAIHHAIAQRFGSG
jgi:hypothetical protein